MLRLLAVSSSIDSSGEAIVGAVVGCDRVLAGVVTDAVDFKSFFNRAIRSAYPVETVGLIDEMLRWICSIEMVGIERIFFLTA